MSPRVNPNQVCEVCRGTGHSYVEHPDGTLTEIECQYCHGLKDSSWVLDKAKAREHAKGMVKVCIVAYLVFLWLSNGVWGGSDLMFLAHCLAWLTGIGALVWWSLNRKPKAPKASKHAPGFTEPREQVMGATFLGGVLLKSKWDHRHPRA
jgi:hypothetical protein